jgi:hypothetical protein
VSIETDAKKVRMARQGSGWSLAHGEDLVTFTCEGCGVRMDASQRKYVHDIVAQGMTVCSMRCFRLAERVYWRREDDTSLHLLVCDTHGCYRCNDILYEERLRRFAG